MEFIELSLLRPNLGCSNRGTLIHYHSFSTVGFWGHTHGEHSRSTLLVNIVAMSSLILLLCTHARRKDEKRKREEQKGKDPF